MADKQEALHEIFKLVERATVADDWSLAIEAVAQYFETQCDLKISQACLPRSNPLVVLLKPRHETSTSFGPRCTNSKCKAHIDALACWRASMTTVAVQRAADKTAWAAALEKAKIDWEAVVSSVQIEADKLSTTATTAIDSLGKKLQQVQGSLADSEDHVEVVQKELRALKSDARNPANLAVRNLGFESELFELKKLHSSLELEMDALKKRATVADNLKLENARLKKRLSQPELAPELKAAVARSHKVDGLETQLTRANFKVTDLERELKATRKARDGVTTVIAQKNIMFEKQEKLLAAIRLKVSDLRTNLGSHEERLKIAAVTISGLEDIAPYVNQLFVMKAVRTLRKINTDNASTLKTVQRLTAGSRGDGWRLVEATQNIISQAFDQTTENIRLVLKTGNCADILLLGGVLDPEDFPGFTEVRRRRK